MIMDDDRNDSLIEILQIIIKKIEDIERWIKFG